VIKAAIIGRDSAIRSRPMTLATVEAAVPTLDSKSVCPRLWRGSPYIARTRGEEEGRGLPGAILQTLTRARLRAHGTRCSAVCT
jgi:hypothetical protein